MEELSQPEASAVRTSHELKTSGRADGSHPVGIKRKHDESDASTMRESKKLKAGKNVEPKIASHNSALRRFESKTTIQDKITSLAHVELSTPMDEKAIDQKLRDDQSAMTGAIDYLGKKIKATIPEEGSSNLMYRLKNMRTPLKDYQLPATAWMMRIEKAQKLPNGGILADSMGIGKSIETISCAVANPPTSKDRKNGSGSVLYIMPNRDLIDQWVNEHLTHVEGIDEDEDIVKYVGQGRVKARALRQTPYVFATYSTVEREFRLGEKDPDKRGPLFKVDWYRIVLDEGDSIKNLSGKASKACAELRGRYRWVLSATPLRNAVEETLAYFRFIGIDMHQPRHMFEATFGPLEEDSRQQRIIQVMSVLMLRREKGELFMGRELCKLPDSEEIVLKFPLSDQESLIYKTHRTSIRDQAEIIRGNAYLDLVDDKKSSGGFLYQDLCIKLRQATDHPFYCDLAMRADIPSSRIEELLAGITTSGFQVSPYKHLMANSVEARRLVSHDEHGELIGIQDMALDMRQYLTDILMTKNKVICPMCHEDEVDKLRRNPSCEHVICTKCLRQVVVKCSNKSRRGGHCPICGVRWMIGKSLNHKEDLPTENSIRMMTLQDLKGPKDEIDSSQLAKKLGFGSPGDDVKGIQPHLKKHSSGCRWLEQCDAEGLVVASTKLVLALAIVLAWLRADIDDKIVVFIEFNLSAKILQRMLEQMKLKFVCYWGDMSPKDRKIALKTFKEDAKTKVMITSVSAGGVGLNITCANKAIFMSPWFNSTKEKQAFGRLKRHGQTKKTTLVRLIAEGTIDEALLNMQELKSAALSQALDKDIPDRRLSMEDYFCLLVGESDPELEEEDSDHTSDEDSEDESDEDSEDDCDYEP
ncbi:SNF2 family N-terminal domain-containing protein [Xylariaceae sp. FL1272]|nr:SNF2 family N-terminal domain-containing protein [Xylariaceae sp. FL1272]